MLEEQDDQVHWIQKPQKVCYSFSGRQSFLYPYTNDVIAFAIVIHNMFPNHTTKIDPSPSVKPDP